MSDEWPIVTICTDGGADPNPGPGGWGVVLIHQATQTVKELSGGEPETTNNRMELTAAIRALESLKKPCVVHLYTDSQYLKRGITEWLPHWIARGWQRKGGPIETLDLWQQLTELAGQHRISWEWVKGHAGHHCNQRADALATAAIREQYEALARQNPGGTVIYLRVSCLSAGIGPGGWAALIRDAKGERVLSGRHNAATANHLDILAATEALLALPEGVHVQVYTASDYLCNGITRWVDGWIKRNWRTKDQRPVKHQEVWQQLWAAAQARTVTWLPIRDESLPEFDRLGEVARREARWAAE